MYGQTTRWGLYDDNGIAPTMVAAMGEGGGYVPMVKTDKCIQIGNLESSYDQSGRIYDAKGISPTIMSNSHIGGYTPPKILNNESAKCVRIGGIFDTEKTKHQAGSIYDKDGISPTLDVMQGGWRQPSIIEDKLLIKNNTKKGYLEATEGDGIDISSRMQYHRGNVQKGMIQTLDCQGGNSKGVVDSELRVRKLTPKECWRLMGFDDEDFEKAEKVNSNTQLYKQAGNSICVPVLERIFENLLKGE